MIVYLKVYNFESWKWLIKALTYQNNRLNSFQLHKNS